MSQGECPANWEGFKSQYGTNYYTFDDTNNIPWIHGKEDDGKKDFNMKGNGVRGTDPKEKTVWLQLDSITNRIASSDESNRLDYARYETDCDLSMKSGKMTTANSYMIHSKGTYKIPLVYGNAIKDGETNRAAFTCDRTGSDILKNFLRHDDQPITEPWIKDNEHVGPDGKRTKIIPDHATIERFQSVNGFSTDPEKSGEINFDNLTIDEEKKYLKFEFHKKGKNLYPCNALISVRDKDENVLWAWHIWVTTQKPDDRTFSLGDNTVSCIPMGQLLGDKMTFEGRVTYVKIQQRNHNNKETGAVIIKYTQEGCAALDFPESLYYQHGRPIPVSCYLYRKDVNEEGEPRVHGVHKNFLAANFFTGSEITGREIETNPSSIGKVISTPRMLFINNSLVYDKVYINLWNNGTPDHPVKTVYDPCPPGWMILPTGAAWSARFSGTNTEFVNNRSLDASWENNFGFKFNDGFITRGTVMTYNKYELTHNPRYTSFWTSEIFWTSDVMTAPNNGQGGVVQFKFLKDEMQDLYAKPRYKQEYTNNSDGMEGGAGTRFFKPIYLLSILPARER